MEESPLLQPNLLTIYPGSINIENFIPGRVYRESITIVNTSKIPIIITLRASDKSKLILNKSFLRIEVNDSQKVDLVIQDKINYSSKKLPTKPKKIYIHLNGELIEEKYEITLMYFCNKNTFSNFGINNNNIDIPISKTKEIPSYYLTNYQKLGMKTNRTLVMDKTCNIFIKRYETNEVNALKNKINNLIQQISYLKQNTGKINPGEINISGGNFKNLSKSRKFLFIMSNKLDDPQGKFKIDNDVDKNAVIAKNKILNIENSILSKRVKMLEEKLSNIRDVEEKNDFNEYNYNDSNNNNYYLENNIKNNNDKEIENDNDDNNEYNEQINYQDFQYQDDEKNIDINDYDNFGNDE